MAITLCVNVQTDNETLPQKQLITAEYDSYRASVMKTLWVPLWKKIPTWCRGNVKQKEHKVLKRHNAPLRNIGLHVREHDSAHFSMEDSAVISWRNM